MTPGNALKKKFLNAGFVLARGGGNKHQTWRCPCGHTQVTSPSSPGKGRSIPNMEALLARTLRACEAIEQQRSAA